MASKLSLTVAIFVGLLASSNSLSSPNDDNRSGKTEKREDSDCDMTCDDFPAILDESSDCVNIQQIPIVIDQLQSNLSLNTMANRELLGTTLDGFCNTECYDNVVFYYTNCTLNAPPVPPPVVEDKLDLYQNLVCGRDDDDTYCAVAVLEDLADGDINPLEIKLQCNTDADVCPRQECINILERISDSLGCCAGSLFNSSVTWNSPFLNTLNEEYYEKCNLTLPVDCNSNGCAFVSAKPFVIALVPLALLLFAF